MAGFSGDIANQHSKDNNVSGNVIFGTSELCQSSATVRELEPMSEEHARMWVRYWRSREFIS